MHGLKTRATGGASSGTGFQPVLANCNGAPRLVPRALYLRIDAMTENLRRLIRDIPDFPKPGILFRDITPLLANPSGLALAVELLANPFRGQNIDLVVGAESRGFIFGTAVACCLSAGFI